MRMLSDLTPRKLAEAASATGWTFERCGYGEQARHSDILAALQKTYADYSTGEYPNEKAAVENLFARLDGFAPLVKHIAFSSEKEWRLVSPPLSNQSGSGTKYREGSASLIPYVEFSLHGIVYPEHPRVRFGLRKVTVGPGPNGDASLHAVQGFLSTNGIHIGVGLSEIPYRQA